VLGSLLLALPRWLGPDRRWKPTQTITYVIGVAAGGSVDLYARGIKNALETLNLVNGQTVVADNKPGAGGLLALQQLQRSRGNAHNLGTFHTGSLAGQVTGILKADMREYRAGGHAGGRDHAGGRARRLAPEDREGPGRRAQARPGLGQDRRGAAAGLNTHLAIAKPLKVAGIDITKLTVVPFRSSATR
jgi:putative tricarboxylic transport membrane protein